MIATPASKRTSSASAANCAIPGVWHVALLPASSGPAHANARGGVSTRLHPRQNTGAAAARAGRGAAAARRACSAHAGNATEQRAMLGECAARTRTWAHAFVGRRREAIRRHGQQRAAEAGAEHMLQRRPGPSSVPGRARSALPLPALAARRRFPARAPPVRRMRLAAPSGRLGGRAPARRAGALHAHPTHQAGAQRHPVPFDAEATQNDCSVRPGGTVCWVPEPGPGAADDDQTFVETWTCSRAHKCQHQHTAGD
jgi:hypothetical protein